MRASILAALAEYLKCFPTEDLDALLPVYACHAASLGSLPFPRLFSEAEPSATQHIHAVRFPDRSRPSG